jgi:hypothetical protein
MMFKRLELTPRPPMTDARYFDAVQCAADELRAAEPWLLLPYEQTELWVAVRRTRVMRWVVAVVNLWRRPRRWYLGRLVLARERRYFLKGDRNQ